MTLRGPDGAESSFTENGAEISFVPSVPGEYELTVVVDGGTQSHYVFVDGTVPGDAGFTVTFVDRVDECVTRYLTDNGTFVCESGTRLISGYDLDGGLKYRFSGAKLGVIGNEIWTTVGSDVEHRTDLPDGVRFDGSLRDELVSVESQFWNGESSAGRSVRSGPNGVVEVLWDGGTLSTGRRVGMLQWPQALAPFFDGSSLMGTDRCVYRPGCTTMVCTTVRTCPDDKTYEEVLTLDDEHFWLSTAHGAGNPVRMVQRHPSAGEGTVRARVIPWQLFGPRLHTTLPGRLDPLLRETIYLVAEGVLVPTRHGFYFLKVDGIVAAPKKAFLIWVDPFTVRIVPR